MFSVNVIKNWSCFIASDCLQFYCLGIFFTNEKYIIMLYGSYFNQNINLLLLLGGFVKCCGAELVLQGNAMPLRFELSRVLS